MSVSHVCIVVTPAQFEERKTFYTAVLATLGYKEWQSNETFVGFANPTGIPDFFITTKDPSVREPTRNVHFGFKAPDRETVHKFHEAALAAGAKDNGAPGPRDYMPTYYAGFVHDAAGNNVECTHF